MKYDEDGNLIIDEYDAYNVPPLLSEEELVKEIENEQDDDS